MEKPTYPRANFVAGVAQKPLQPQERSWLGFFRGNNKPLPPQGLKKKTMPPSKTGGTRNYNLRAAQFLSERSPALQKVNLKKLKSRRNRRTIARVLNKTRRTR